MKDYSFMRRQVRALIIQPGPIQPGDQQAGRGVLTMMGTVLARDRICLTRRYLSYSGFIT